MEYVYQCIFAFLHLELLFSAKSVSVILWEVLSINHIHYLWYVLFCFVLSLNLFNFCQSDGWNIYWVLFLLTFLWLSMELKIFINWLLVFLYLLIGYLLIAICILKTVSRVLSQVLQIFSSVESFLLRLLLGQVQWLTPVFPALWEWETKVGGSLEPRSSSSGWAT